MQLRDSALLEPRRQDCVFLETLVGSMSCILPSLGTLRDRRGLELGSVRDRGCPGDGTAGRPARNKVSDMNTIRMALVGSQWHTFWVPFCAISLGPEATRNGGLLRWAELRSPERKPLICRALCSFAEPCVARFCLSPTNLRLPIEGVESPFLTVKIARPRRVPAPARGPIVSFAT
jgi:hypothetical protein